MDTPTVTLLPLHTPQLEDGTPVLRGGGGRRIRYTVQPLDEPSQASLASTAEPATSLSGAPVCDEELVAPAPKNCVCPVCSRLFVDPVAAACKHAVCRACFDAAEKGSEPCCPVCMKAAPVLKPQPMLSWLVDSLEVRCPASAEGCTAVVPRGRLAAHLESCAHVRVTCPHAELGCGARVARADLGAHLRGCPFESCAAFMVSTLRRLEALEADNRSLRAELRAQSASLSWAEASVAHPCADCGALFRPDEGWDAHRAEVASGKCKACSGGERAKHRLDEGRLSTWRSRKRRHLEEAAKPTTFEWAGDPSKARETCGGAPESSSA